MAISVAVAVCKDCEGQNLEKRETTGPLVTKRTLSELATPVLVRNRLMDKEMAGGSIPPSFLRRWRALSVANRELE